MKDLPDAKDARKQTIASEANDASNEERAKKANAATNLEQNVTTDKKAIDKRSLINANLSLKQTRNSLESLGSKFSQSSANDVTSTSQRQTHLRSVSPSRTSASNTPTELLEYREEDKSRSKSCSPNGNSKTTTNGLNYKNNITIINVNSGPQIKRFKSQTLRATSQRAQQNNGINSEKNSDPMQKLDSVSLSASLSRCDGCQDMTVNGCIKIPSDLPPATISGAVPKEKGPFMFAGIVGSLVVSVMFSFSVLCVKILPNGEGIQEKMKILFSRSFIIIICCSVTIVGQKSTFKVRRDEIWVCLLRAMFGFLCVMGAYTALNYISLGDSTALIFASPIWTSLLSHFILKEPLQWILILALPACILGIILIAHPSLIVDVGGSAAAVLANQTMVNSTISFAPDIVGNLTELASIDSSSVDQYEYRWPGVVIALATSLCASIIYIVLKFRKETPIQTTTFWFGVLSTFCSFFVMCGVGFGSMPSGWEWLLMIVNGSFSWAGQCIFQWSLKYEDASVLSIIRTLDVAMSFILSAIFLNDEILWTSVLGAAVIGGVVVSMVLNNWFRAACLTKIDDKNTSNGNHEKCCSKGEIYQISAEKEGRIISNSIKA